MTSPGGGQADRRWMHAQDEEVYGHIAAEFPALCLSVVRPDGSPIIVVTGETYAHVSGYEAYELESDPAIWLGLVHPADSARVQEAYRRLAAGSPMQERYRIYRKDGQMRSVLETGIAGGAAESGTCVLRCILETSGSAEDHVPSVIGFKKLVDDTPVGISVRDLDGRVIYCNHAYAATFGYDWPEQMIGTDFREIMAPVTLEEFQKQAFPWILRGAWSGEVEVRRKDGKVLHLRLSTNVFRDLEGEPVAVHTVLLDMTELKSTQQALLANQRLLEAVQDSMPASLAVIDTEGNVIAVNERWRRFARENGDPELLHTCEGANYLEVCRNARGPRSEGADEVLRGLEAILRGESSEFETEYPCPSTDRSRWFFMRASPLAGEQQGAVVAHIDISRRKRAEEALRHSEERYHSLLENLDAIVFRMGADMRLLAITGRVESMLGYSADELWMRPSLWREVVHPDDIPKVMELMQIARDTRSPSWIEIRLRHSSGRLVWIRGTLTPIFDDAGDLLYFDGVSLDITERVEAQERDARHTARMRILTEISQQCASSLDSRQIVQTVTEQLCKTLDCVAAGVNIEPVSGRLINLSLCCPKGCNARNLDKKMREADLRVETVFGMIDVAPRIVPDLSLSSPSLAGFAKKGGLKPGMIAPVTTGEDVVGILLAARKPGEHFDHEDLWLLTEVASHASAALANSAIYRRQALIAETLQRTLIPPEPAIGFLDIATLYAPAPGEARVGGDFFDLFRCDAKRVALVVGDVSGKGVEAAIHTAEAKYMLRAFAHQDPDPLHVVSSLNAALFSYLPTEAFITLAYFVLDVDEHVMHYVNAGHETSLVLCRDEQVIREIGPNGPMLGVTSSVAYTEGRVEFYPDDFLFCYTDGVIDVRMNGDRFGFDRLLNTVAAATAEDARRLMDSVMSAVRSFGSARQTDDQVVVVVRPLA